MSLVAVIHGEDLDYSDYTVKENDCSKRPVRKWKQGFRRDGVHQPATCNQDGQKMEKYGISCT